MPQPSTPLGPPARSRCIRRRAALLALLVAAALALPTAAQALATPPFAGALHAASAPQPAPSPAPNPAPGPVPSPTPGPSPNPTPGPGTGAGSGAGGGGSTPSPGGGSGRLPAPQPMPSPPGSTSSGPSWWDIPGQVEHAIDQWFGDLVKAALTPIMNLIGKTVLSNPDTTGGRTGQLWTATLVIANSIDVLFAIVGGLVVMTHQTVQTRYALGQIAPRLVLGLIAANTSLLVVGKAIELSNTLTQAIWGQPLDPAGIGNKLLGTILDSIFVPDGITQIFMVLFGLVLAVLAGAVLFSAALRTAGLMLLTFSAPLALSCHALPGLDAVAKLWWRAFAAVFAIQILQALTLILALQTFFDPDGDVLGVPTSAGFTDLLVCGALFVILLKIPGWVLRVALGRQPRTGALGMLKSAAAAALGTAIGVPGIASTRMLAGRFAGRMLRGRSGPGPGGGSAGSGGNPGGGPGPKAPRGPRPTPPRPGRGGAARAARPPSGATRGRPVPSSHPPLSLLPPGSQNTPANPAPGPAPGTPPAPASGSAGAAPSSVTPSQVPGSVQPPQSPPALGSMRARQMPLFRVPANQRAQRTTPPPSAGTTWSAPSHRQLPLFPRTPPRPRPASAPSATPGSTPVASSMPVPRVVPVRLPGPAPRPPKPAKNAADRARKKGGE